jgi:GNAT superfamily N-acetyltransferase
MSEADLPQVVAAWNSVLIHDQVSVDHLRHAVLGDPNYEPEGVVVAESDGGRVPGLSACIVRRTVEGKDGQGADWEFDVGFLKAFFVADGADAQRTAAELLEASEAFCRQAGKRAVQLTLYSHHYFFPGLDLRYERLREIVARHGYRDIATIEDVAVDLRAEEIAARLERSRRRAGADAEVLTWEPSLVPMMRPFVEEGRVPHWFPVGWEAHYSQPDETVLVLRRDREIIGWARFWPGKPRAGFGPILVLPRERDKGYGALLLLECMSRAQAQGSQRMAAGWANTGFYVSQGWSIVRRYAVFRKELAT